MFFPNTTLGTEVKEAIATYEVPVLESVVRNPTEYTKAARLGLTAMETNAADPAARDIRALVEEISKLLEAAGEGIHATS